MVNLEIYGDHIFPTFVSRLDAHANCEIRLNSHRTTLEEAFLFGRNSFPCVKKLEFVDMAVVENGAIWRYIQVFITFI